MLLELEVSDQRAAEPADREGKLDRSDVSGGSFTISNSTFNNLAGGTFTLDGNNDVHGAGFPTDFNNQGTFIKQAGR